MDPIHPITPGPPAISRGSTPLERLQRVSRERDRRHKDELARDGKRPPPRPRAPQQPHSAAPEHTPGFGEPEEGEGTHIDVRV